VVCTPQICLFTNADIHLRIEKARQLATAKVSDRDRKQAIESSAASGLIVIYQTLGNEKAAQDLLMQQAKTFTRFTRGNNNLLPENNP
jgi:hypothetical protein